MTKIIRDRDGSYRPFIVALTANAFDEDKEKCFEVGMDAFLSKPISISTLKETIANLENEQKEAA